MSMTARDAIESLENDVFVSAASAWELTTEVRIGKLPRPPRGSQWSFGEKDTDSWLSRACRQR